MDRSHQIKFVALLTLAVTGCTFDVPPEADAPQPVETPAAELPQETQSFNNPVVSTPDTAGIASATPNLIQSTNAKERELIVSKGRDDPFAQIIGQTASTVPITTSPRPVPPIPPLPTSPVQRPLTPSAPLSAGSTTTATPPKPDTLQGSVIPKVLPSVVSNSDLESVLPPPPQPDLAKAVMVTGVVLIGQKPQAIIQVPTEKTSRYVQAGQRLSSGLLVKRIEMNEGSNPIVILEQYGIEVARMVGEEPVNAASSATNVEAS
ncbi:hypothetical protein [Nodularia sp. UHCC 0506]|uniref:hypothetical protein n=1 Tax=Nodularia sp. UHCC 0506 TaxID=3110243 RepID=UPI002B2012C5|nr:hypothetical protein [Nodularia sp. UHCC 0506]MEA5516808.1 hypothetical protein [Nodularia sp. UHCC 0506]